MLPHLAIQYGLSYTAVSSYGQSSAAGCSDKGATTETLVWGAIGGDIGSSRYFPCHLGFTHLSEQWHCSTAPQATIPGRPFSAYLDNKGGEV